MKTRPPVQNRNNYFYIKRLLDILISFFALLILLPIIILVLVLNFISCKENPIFIQERIGLNMRPFKLIKFKTMIECDEIKINWSHGRKKITKIGKLLRKYSIDELLSLINVLKGDMSLVGPRPLYLIHVKMYNQRGHVRHLVKPGITGLAQVMGRNNVSWEKRFNYDCAYIKLASLRMDFFILFKTIFVVFNKNGYNENGDEVIVEKY